MKTNDGRLVVIAGASRSGKTAYARQAVDSVLPELAGRAWAWDPEDQWAALPGWQRVTSRAELLQLAHGAGPQRVAFVAGGDLSKAFDFWAGCVQYACRYVAPLAAVAEELADVTSPAKAPGNWGILLRRGLKRGAHIFALSQRWAEADKTALGNASEFVIFRQVTGDDSRYMSRKTRVPESEINALPPLEFIRYDTATFASERGKLAFRAKKSPSANSAKRGKSP